MSRYAFSTQARQDLKDIKDDIARDSLDRSESLVKSIAERFKKLANFPGIGTGIFYHPTEEGVAIERTLSGYRDLDALFQNEDENWLVIRRREFDETVRFGAQPPWIENPG